MSNTREYNNAVRQYWMNRENPQNNETTKGILNIAKLGYQGNRAIKQAQKGRIGADFITKYSDRVSYEGAPEWFKKLYSFDEVNNMMSPEFMNNIYSQGDGFFSTMKDAFMPSAESAKMQSLGSEAVAMGDATAPAGASGAGGAGAGTGLGVAMGFLALGVGAGKKVSTFNRWANKLK